MISAYDDFSSNDFLSRIFAFLTPASARPFDHGLLAEEGVGVTRISFKNVSNSKENCGPLSYLTSLGKPNVKHKILNLSVTVLHLALLCNVSTKM